VSYLKVVHVITGLNVGGAEQMLARLLPGLAKQGVTNMVVSLAPRGPLAEPIELSGVRVASLALSAGRAPLRGLAALVGLLRRERPDVVQGWLYHANLLATLAGPLAGGAPIVWNIRSAADLRGYGRVTALTIRLGASLSRRPRAIIVNSDAARRQHETFGYRPREWALIPNGFDLDRFRPDPAARCAVRDELGLPPGAQLVGHFGRFHPIKRHDVLLAAARRLLPRHAGLHFLLVGPEVTGANPALQGVLPPELGGRVHFLGERPDVPRLMAALDVLALSSDSESFPNVVGEAMACGVPCATTDVGDVARLVGETGVVVPRRDPDALAAGLEYLLELTPDEARAMGARARARIAASYSLESVVARYAALYRALAGANPSGEG